MTGLALVQSGWVVDETPVVDAPWEPHSAAALDDEWVAAVASITIPDGGRYPRPTKWAVFVARPDAGPTQLAQFTDFTTAETGTGTGVTVQIERDGGYELQRVATQQPAPALVSLGVFKFSQLAVSCDDELTACAIIERNGALTLWKKGRRQELIAGSESIEGNPDFGDLRGAALDPTGRYLGLALQSNAGLVDLATGQVTLFRARLTTTAPSLVKAIEALANPESALSRKLERSSQECVTVPQGWSDGRLVISHSTFGEVGAAPCPVLPFEYDPKTKRRSPVPPYAWDVLDCPRGGWTSSVGTFVTECEEEVGRMMRPTYPPRPLADGGWEQRPPDWGELPEAVALSPTQIFVMAPARETEWRWFRGPPKKSGGLRFVLTGPSVVSFNPNGVTVEEVPWRHGKAIFEAPLADDWHLVELRGRTPLLVRLRQDPPVTSTGR